MESTRESKLGSYAEQSPFVRLLETPGRVRILDVLLRRPASRMTAAEISEAANIDPGTFSRNKDVLLALDIIEQHLSDDGRRTVYRISTDNPVVEILMNAHSELLEYAPSILEDTEVETESWIGIYATTISQHAEGTAESDDAIERVLEEDR